MRARIYTLANRARAFDARMQYVSMQMKPQAKVRPLAKICMLVLRNECMHVREKSNKLAQVPFHVVRLTAWAACHGQCARVFGNALGVVGL